MAANRRMESRIRDLESEFDMESRRSADMEKNLRKAERQIKELNCLETDRHIEGQRMEKMISQLTAEMERLQTRLDEAHQIGALNLANYRLADSNNWTKSIQLWTFAYVELLNQLYENEVTLREQNLPLECFHPTEMMIYFRRRQIFPYI